MIGQPLRPSRGLAVPVLAAALLVAAGALAQVELGPPADRSVHDLAGVINPEHEAAMERVHRELFAKTGVAIVVITVPELDGEPIEDFAVRVASEWGVGKRGEDRGIVLALSVAERRVFVATGYGVEGYLPDGRVGGIMDQYMLPALQRDDFSSGLLQGSLALVAASAEEYGITIEGVPESIPRAPRGEPAGNPFSGILGIIVMIAMVILFIRHPRLALLLLLSGMGRGGRGGGGFGGGGGGFGGFGGGGFGGGGAGRGF